jgi:hypothetical protein
MWYFCTTTNELNVVCYCHMCGAAVEDSACGVRTAATVMLLLLQLL